MNNNSASFNYSGTSVVVTGGASGLGLAIARAFLRSGARLTIMDLNEEAGQKAITELSTIGSDVKFIAVDVSDHTSVARGFEQLDALGRAVNLQVNSAGIREIATTIDIAPEYFERVVSINLNGTFFAAQQAARRMRENGGGGIINIASVAGMVAIKNRPAYIASKHGVIGLTKLLAADFAQYGIRVNAIAPGTIRTPLTEKYYHEQEFLEGLASVVPMGSAGDVDDIANAALFLGSELSGFVTGTTLPVDGGWVAEKTYSPNPSAYSRV